MQVEQYALLSNMMYFDDFVFDKRLSIGENLKSFQQESPNEWNKFVNSFGNSMINGSKKTQHIADAIINDPDLSNLKIIESTRVSPKDTTPVMMALENQNKKELTFVFRGTNGMEWLDNSIGLQQESTILQKHALKFVDKVLSDGDYSDYHIAATGHSKGGNKAKFCTILDDRINQCYSFDGQGFSKEFMNKYSEQIKKNEHKICNYSADADPVNVLGCTIGNSKYYRTSVPKEEEDISSTLGLSDLARKIPIVKNAFAHSATAFIHFDANDGTCHMNKQTEMTMTQKKLHDASLIMLELPAEERQVCFDNLMTILQKTNEHTPELKHELNEVYKDSSSTRNRVMKEQNITKALFKTKHKTVATYTPESVTKKTDGCNISLYSKDGEMFIGRETKDTVEKLYDFQTESQPKIADKAKKICQKYDSISAFYYSDYDTPSENSIQRS